jgi:hypothetical protein
MFHLNAGNIDICTATHFWCRIPLLASCFYPAYRNISNDIFVMNLACAIDVFVDLSMAKSLIYK